MYSAICMRCEIVLCDIDFCKIYFPTNNPQLFLWITADGQRYNMTCPPGTIFDTLTCHCLQNGTGE